MSVSIDPARALAGMMAGPMGVDATYAAPYATGFALRVIPRRGDATLGASALQSRARAATLVVAAAAADLAAGLGREPRGDDKVTISGEVWRVAGASRPDPRETFWLLDLQPDHPEGR